ncbi:MAG: DNA internalization-related competence protein ComEC/Rec2 [Eubacteriales bacterium]|nr:DNA internalization-related competence protein ComEC/Rec2 [Eubacteriales bacterium]
MLKNHRIYLRQTRPCLALAAASLLPALLLYHQNYCLLTLLSIAYVFLAIKAYWRLPKLKLLLPLVFILNLSRVVLALSGSAADSALEQAYCGNLSLGKILWESEASQSFQVEALAENGNIYALVLDLEHLNAKSVELCYRLTRPDPGANPGAFDNQAWLAGKGIFHQAYPVGKVTVIDGRGLAFAARRQFLFSVNKNLSDWGFSNDSSGLLQSLVLGVKGSLANEIKEDFRRIGLSHLLAVSGMHLMFLLKPLALTQTRWPRGFWRNFFDQLGMISFGAYLTGGAAGFLRAGLLCLLRQINTLSATRFDPLNILALGLALSGLASPFAILDHALLWSYAASGAIFLFAEKIQKQILVRWPFLQERLVSSFASLFAAQLAVSLLSLSSSRRICPLFMIWQPLFIALAEMLFIFALPLVVWAGLSANYLPKLMTVLSWPVRILSGLFLHLARSLAKWEVADNMGIRLDVYWLIALWVILIFHFMAKQRLERWSGPQGRRALRIILLGISLASLLLPRLWPGKPKAYFVDVGQGDAMIVTWRDRAILVDGGVCDAAEANLLPFMDYLGLNYFDYALLSHQDRDHSGAAAELLSRGKIKALILPPCFTEQEFGWSKTQPDFEREKAVSYYLLPKGRVQLAEKTERELKQKYPESITNNEQILALAARREIPVLRAWPGDRFLLDDELYLEVLAASLPQKQITFSSNANSLCCLLHWGPKALLLTGDAELINEEIYCSIDRQEVDLLKVSHHGSNSASSEAFLDRSKPRCAVVSVGKNNYGHPATEVLRRLEERGITLLRTDHDGCIRFTLDRQGRIRLETWKSRRRLNEVE